MILRASTSELSVADEKLFATYASTIIDSKIAIKFVVKPFRESEVAY